MRTHPHVGRVVDALMLVVCVSMASLVSVPLASAQGTCVEVNTCTGGSYSVQKDFAISNPGTAPTNTSGPATGGFCVSSETYTTYVSWCNESGCTAMSPASTGFQPATGSTNYITVTRPSIPSGTTSWAAYFSKASEPTAVRHCSSTTTPAGTVSASTTTVDCSCLPQGWEHHTSNSTGAIQTSKLDPDGRIRVSATDGTVQRKLTTEKNIVEYTTDLVPRISPDAGVNYRTVDWNSATVYYVDATAGAANNAGKDRTVFNSIVGALAAITDSSYTKPYVIKVRSRDGTEVPLGVTTVLDPYVWIQGDGSARAESIRIRADGVRVSGMIVQEIEIGSSLAEAWGDIDNVWVTNNIVTQGTADGGCGISVHVGGGGRRHSIHVSNNRVGVDQDSGSTDDVNDCSLGSKAVGIPGPTEIHFTDNYVENGDCLHNGGTLFVVGDDQASEVATENVVFSTRNTFVCNIASALVDPGENYGCIVMMHNLGHLTSVDDVCLIVHQAVNNQSSYYYVFAETDRPYLKTYQRSADFINPTLLVSLPAPNVAGNHIAFVMIDTPYWTVSITNPRYRELALGSGWTADQRNFALIGGARTPPPSNSNTFLRWSGVVESPGPNIEYYLGATSASVTAGPIPSAVPASMGKAMLLTGVNLPSSCTANDLRYDTGGSTKEICLCNSSGTWNCFPLGAHID